MIPDTLTVTTVSLQQNIPSGWNPSRKRIVKEYLKLRSAHMFLDVPIVKAVAMNLDYRIDKNGSNDFVRRVLRQFLSDVSSTGPALARGTSSTTIQLQAA